MGLVNYNALATTLDIHRTQQGISWRALAKHTGIAPTTLSRLTHGYAVEVDTYIVLCRWLNVPLDTFISTADPENDRVDLKTDLVLLLHRHEVPEAQWTPLYTIITGLQGKNNEHHDH